MDFIPLIGAHHGPFILARETFLPWTTYLKPLKYCRSYFHVLTGDRTTCFICDPDISDEERPFAWHSNTGGPTSQLTVEEFTPQPINRRSPMGLDLELLSRPLKGSPKVPVTKA